jgi:hypothetical protein
MAVMMGIHDIFPQDADDSNDPISKKKLLKCKGQYSRHKTLLGFDFDGTAKTMWLEVAKREKLLTVLKGWICSGKRAMAGIPFKEFKSIMAKLCHAFTCIPAGVGLLLPCNWILKLQLPYVYFHRNLKALNSIEGCRTLLWESTREPTWCCELTCGWPDFIGIVSASSHSIGGVIFGKRLVCTPMLFHWQ